MAPPSGEETPTPYASFTMEHESDRWRPKTTATNTPYPHAPISSQEINEGPTMTQYIRLKAFFTEAMSDVMNAQEIAAFAM